MCDDLRIGGTLSASGLSGGQSINNSGLIVQDWSALFGHSGYSKFITRVNGRPGGYFVGDSLGKERYLTLSMAITRSVPTGRPDVGTPEDQGWANMDYFLGVLGDPDGFYLEVDAPDVTRFIRAYAPDPSPVDWFREERRMVLPLVSEWPYWHRGGTEISQAISGSAAINVPGNVDVYDAVLTFPSGGATYTNNTAGWSLVVAASGAGVTVVDLGARTITLAGVDADNLLTSRSSRDWGWFVPGSNSITTTASVTTVLRGQYN